MTSLKPYIKLIRPHQYLKNIFVFTPWFFGGSLGDMAALGLSLLIFVYFSLVASSIYIINDLKDLELDRAHPTKRKRPLAAGLVPVPTAVVLAVAMGGGALVLSALTLPYLVLVVLAGYLALNLAYSSWLKHVAILDIACIATGFVLRVWAGGFATGIMVSHWLTLMTFLLALFIALSKRREDLLLDQKEHKVRPSIKGYNLETVSLGMVLMASVVIVCYIMYTVSPEVTQKHGTTHLYITSFWVVLGVLRYLNITFVEQKSGSPTRVFLSDTFLWVVGLGWALTFVVLIRFF